MKPEALLIEMGRRLHAARKARSLSLTEAAERASVSSRYLRMAEAGQANMSVLKLASLARALRVELSELCDLKLGDAPEMRIALLGVRGSGKSSVGRELAHRLEVPFFELDTLIEEQAGVPLGQIFSIHGEDLYRQLQRETLERWLAQNGSGVLATGGSIVTDPVAFDRLRQTCRTVWLRASAEEHWRRVVGQGDLRPMQHRPRAMVELRTMIETRAPHYATADLQVDTMQGDPRSLASRIGTWVVN